MSPVLLRPSERKSSLSTDGRVAGLWLDLQARPLPIRSSLDSDSSVSSGVSPSSTLVGEESHYKSSSDEGFKPRADGHPSSKAAVHAKKRVRPLPLLPRCHSNDGPRPRALPAIPCTPQSAPLSGVHPHSPIPCTPQSAPFSGIPPYPPTPSARSGHHHHPSLPVSLSSTSLPLRERTLLKVPGNGSPRRAHDRSLSVGVTKSARQAPVVPSYAAAEIADELERLGGETDTSERDDADSDFDSDDDDLDDLDEEFSVQVVRGVAYRTADIRRVSRLWHGRWVHDRGGKQWDPNDYSVVMSALRAL